MTGELLTPESIDRVCAKLAKLWKHQPEKTLAEILLEPSHQGVLGRWYGSTRVDRWNGSMTNAQFEKCVDETLKDKEAGL